MTEIEIRIEPPEGRDARRLLHALEREKIHRTDDWDPHAAVRVASEGLMPPQGAFLMAYHDGRVDLLRRRAPPGPAGPPRDRAPAQAATGACGAACVSRVYSQLSWATVSPTAGDHIERFPVTGALGGLADEVQGMSHADVSAYVVTRWARGRGGPPPLGADPQAGRG